MSEAKDKQTLFELMTAINDEIAAALQKNTEQTRKRSDEERRQLGRYICVQVAGTEMAIKLSSILEAGELTSVRSLPLLPRWIPGIANIRGDIVSVVDLERFFGLAGKNSADKLPFLRVGRESMKLAVTVGGILRTRMLYTRDRAKYPDQGNMPYSDYLAGHAWYLQDDEWIAVGLFDLERFLASDKLLRSIH